MGFKREWIQWLAEHKRELQKISPICSAPDCENDPVFVYDTGNFLYCLCEKCADLVRFEKKYAVTKEKQYDE